MNSPQPAPTDDPIAAKLRVTPEWWLETYFCLVVWLTAAVIVPVGVAAWGRSPWWLILTVPCCLAVVELLRQLRSAWWLTRNAEGIMRVLDGDGDLR
ncbi:MAG: hypothetical protein ACRDRL_03445 [Sciscionella sp.]